MEQVTASEGNPKGDVFVSSHIQFKLKFFCIYSILFYLVCLNSVTNYYYYYYYYVPILYNCFVVVAMLSNEMIYTHC